MDLIANGFVTIPTGKEKFVKKDIKTKYEGICLDQHKVKANVTVKITPISEIVANPEERLNFTHAYSVRCRA